LDNEKDIFDLLRESSDNLTEQPSAEAWTRLERKLKTTRKTKRKRRPMLLQITVVTGIILLLFTVAMASWYITHQHQQILRGKQRFAAMQFMMGEWTFSDKKATDVMTWELKDSATIVGEKFLYLDDLLISRFPVLIRNQGKDNVLVFNNKFYTLSDMRYETFIFKAKDNEEVKIRKIADDRYTLSFGEGIVFVFKKGEDGE
jgi:hypothetical protein